METKTPTVHPLHPSNLANFYGTEGYMRFGKLVLTDGTVHVANNGAHWLLTIINVANTLTASIRVKSKGFQCWTLVGNKTGDGAVVTCTDGNGLKLYHQSIPYIDFPLSDWTDRTFTLYVEEGSVDGESLDWVCLLPSER
jgi:hypothetical protein